MMQTEQAELVLSASSLATDLAITMRDVLPADVTAEIMVTAAIRAIKRECGREAAETFLLKMASEVRFESEGEE
jgi:hypothetical protein